jgi:hypothetical protein
MLRCKLSEISSKLITDVPESVKALLFRSLNCSRVFEVVVQPVSMTGKDRAAFPSVVADSQHTIEALVYELVYEL